MKKTYIKDLKNYTEKEVTIAGWIDVRRDQGKMTFFDFRDTTGKIQGVVLPNSPALEMAKETRPEWVVEVKGKVNARPEKMIKKDAFNGDIELEVLDIKVLNKSETPVFEINQDTSVINEETRLKYRYLDLRTDRMQKNIKARYEIIKFIRDYLDKEGFTEIETPLLTKSTPEGARDYLVPSRIYQGKFFALPQAPQQYKQLLMTSGFEKYFQIARCMRDEDLRGDRQPEFTQLDLEMSFVEEEDIITLNEKLLIEIVEKLYPEKKIQQVPFPRITYAEAMEKYGTDRPDMRENKEDKDLLAFCWVVDFPFFEKVAKSDNPQAKGEWTFTHNPFSAPKEKDLEKLMNKQDIGSIIAGQYDIALNGSEIGGGSIRAHKSEILKSTLEIIGYDEEAQKKDLAHMFSAFDMGTPPHGGIAWGLDRLIMILRGEESIREVIAFPKTREARDPMMDSPAEVDKKQLDELGIQLKK
ncbi:hypothetical protein A2996_02295 [Candidatus Campbellbacteria bacterium RIFCSPLOWO2_01_FULL_34_15]|uniref:Aspartate--tRNA ligase n=2 Tax=Candidatus Campbelliibacteriota TaxID=1752727 RepID=A0A1F5ENR8_9BACT|nr:MAG: hypothetical protein A2996_02295 [Candidatus Campbellbacteria bacterium RIFCSPLOWO2_01_FULL_34_15]OGD69100.1 MAG: hypothetical protein A2811_02255 [Candidatus Campbellbacteria bacterium RIFCSPHIGHO2_01_FULL_34_10]